MKHQGEFAVQIQLNEAGGARIVAVQFSDEAGFTPEETTTAFLQAAMPCVEDDEPAVQLFNEYVGGARPETEGMGLFTVQAASPSKYREGTESFGQGLHIESTYAEDYVQCVGKHRHTMGARCDCCAYTDWLVPGFEENTTRTDNTPRPTTYGNPETENGTEVKVFAGKKYKPVLVLRHVTRHGVIKNNHVLRCQGGSGRVDGKKIPDGGRA